MKIDNNFFMSLALKEAWKYQGLTYPNPAVGCTVVGQNGEILAVGAHHYAGGAHAEVKALKAAYFKLTNDSTILSLDMSADIHSYLIKNANFTNISLYTTLEPCSHIGKTPSCANLIISLGIKRVYVGSCDFNLKASKGNQRLLESGAEVTRNILHEECDALVKPFRLWSDKKFVFFKWAQSLDGSTDGSAISSLESRKNVHAMRNVCDLLVIGGNTVRLDRPTLDARLVDGKAPDILIISREKEFDTSIPLFNVTKREVFISDNFSLCEKYKNIMIEGGSNMYGLTKELVDYSLVYIAPKFAPSKRINTSSYNFKILNILQESEDIIMWMKREV